MIHKDTYPPLPLVCMLVLEILQLIYSDGTVGNNDMVHKATYVCEQPVADDGTDNGADDGADDGADSGAGAGVSEVGGVVGVNAGGAVGVGVVVAGEDGMAVGDDGVGGSAVGEAGG
jgi:hypothetical protein